jgi:hypothetical protein
MENVNELAIDISLKKVYEIDGHPLYTSSSLIRQFLEVINKDPRCKSQTSDYIKLVKAGKIVPCYFTKVFLRIFEREFDSKDLPEEAKHVAGFYATNKYKAYILIDRKYLKKLKYAKFLIHVTVHELTHMFSREHPNQFISLFKDDLLKFYSSYFKKVFKLKDDNIETETKDLINFMYHEFEMKGIISTRKLYEKIQENFSKLTTMNEDDFENLLFLYCNIVMIYHHYGIMEIVKSRLKYKEILDPIKETYKEVFDNTVPSIHVQELLTPSEVMCILSETDKGSKFNQMISLLAK